MSIQRTQQRIDLARTSLGKSTSTYLAEGVYVDPEIVAGLQVFNQGKATVYYYRGSYAKHTEISPSTWPDVDVTVVFRHQVSQTDAKEHIRALSKRLCEDHPGISTYEGIFGGIPHLQGLRLSVADILEQLYLTGSIDAVKAIYSPDVSEDQIKEAIAYAQDFLESVFSSRSQVDG